MFALTGFPVFPVLFIVLFLAYRLWEPPFTVVVVLPLKWEFADVLVVVDDATVYLFF